MKASGPTVTPPYLRHALFALACIACSHGQRLSAEPPSHAGAAPSIGIAGASTSQGGATATASTTAQPVADAKSSEPSTALATTPSTAPETPAETVEPVPPLRDSTGKPLPQTEDLPSFDSSSFKRRVELLYQAIVKDDPKLASPAFFPVVAYEQVKAIAQPARDHKQRLLSAFAKNIHEYHRKLGKDPVNAKLRGMAPSTLLPRWMKPGTEGNRLGYHRLLRSRLKVTDARGTEHEFEVTSMISWRGEWYVVHLNGFK